MNATHENLKSLRIQYRDELKKVPPSPLLHRYKARIKKMEEDLIKNEEALNRSV